MYNYTEIVRMARRTGIKLKESTLRKDFCAKKIKPERRISYWVYFSEETVNSYLEEKKQSISRIGRPNMPFTINEVEYKSEKDFAEKTGYSIGTAKYKKRAIKRIEQK